MKPLSDLLISMIEEFIRQSGQEPKEIILGNITMRRLIFEINGTIASSEDLRLRSTFFDIEIVVLDRAFHIGVA